MTFPIWQSLPAMFFEQARRLASRPFLWSKTAGGWRALTYGEVASDVRRVARGLLALGVKPGDRVALVAENRPEWPVADLAIMAIGAITVPTFTTNTAADHRHVLNHSGARGVIVSTKAITDARCLCCRSVTTGTCPPFALRSLSCRRAGHALA